MTASVHERETWAQVGWENKSLGGMVALQMIQPGFKRALPRG